MATTPPRLAATLFLACLIGAGCGGREAEPAPPVPLAESNVIIVLIDTLRADRLGLYGYERRDTSPFLDELAGDAVVFDNAQSNSTFTGEAKSTLFSGRLPSTNPTGTGWFARPDAGDNPMAARFREAGYRTALVSNHPVMKFPGYGDGFDLHAQILEQYAADSKMRETTDAALDFIASGEDPFFVHLHYVDPHSPYTPPDHVVERFVSPAPEKKIWLNEEIKPNAQALKAEGFGPGEERFEDLNMRYDAEIAYVDDEIRYLFARLEALGRLDDTVVVFTSDHGEEFLERGYFFHAWTLYEETLRVPLIFWAPGRLAPARVAERVCLAGVAPTFAAWKGWTPDPDWSEAPLFSADETGAWRPDPQPGPRFGELLVETRTNARSVVDWPYKYIAATRWIEAEHRELYFRAIPMLVMRIGQARWKSFDLWAPVAEERLYNLETDPGERVCLAETETETLARMRAHHAAHREACRDVPHVRRFTEDDPLTLENVKALLAGTPVSPDKEQAVEGEPIEEMTPEEIEFWESHPYLN